MRPLGAAIHSNSYSAVKFLLDCGEDVNSLDPETECTPLNQAVLIGNYDIAELLISYGAPVNPPGNDQIPLVSAVMNQHPKVISLLLSHGASMSVTDRLGWTPLIFASRRGYLSIMKLLVESGAPVNGAGVQGLTPIMTCADPQGVMYLLEKGADVHARNGDGDNCLQMAACLDFPPSVICLLLKAGADPTVTVDGKTPADFARILRFPLAEALLRRAAQDYNPKQKPPADKKD